MSNTRVIITPKVFIDDPFGSDLRMEPLEVTDRGILLEYEVEKDVYGYYLRDTLIRLEISFALREYKQIELNRLYLLKMLMPPDGHNNQEVRIFGVQLQKLNSKEIRAWPAKAVFKLHETEFKVINEFSMIQHLSE